MRRTGVSPLDAARYADTNGFQQDGDTFQWVWRDWVVRALNSDLPFDRFSIEQLAGDLLPKPTDDQLIASAFNRSHLLDGEGGAIEEEQRFNILFDRVDTTATNWLGLTMACAQFHDHKYDPITQRDYYSLLHAFNQVSENGVAGYGPGRMRIAPPFLELPREEDKRGLAEREADLKTAETAGAVGEKTALALAAWTSALTPDSTTPDGKPLVAVLRIAAAQRTEAQGKELTAGLRGQFEEKVWPGIAANDPGAKKVADLKAQIAKYRNEEIARVMVMRDDKPRETFLPSRGEYLKPKDKVSFATPAFLPALAKDLPANRLGFAQWLFQPEHPLTARVQVNRMWQTFFGAGLVKTTEDFGVQSEMPVQGALLDWLAVEFREGGWSMKQMHRLIVTSATYRQSSRVSRELLARDPENRLLARGARFRAPAMILRDVALAASGLLDPRVGGRPVYPYQPDGIFFMTGAQVPGRPSMSAWLSYGLGCEASDLPAFVAMTSSDKGKTCGQLFYDYYWGNGFLPSRFQGVRFRNAGDPVPYLHNPPGMDRAERRALLDDIQAMNAAHLSDYGDPEIFCIAHDITEATELEAKLRHSQKLESIGLLAAGMAHDFILTRIKKLRNDGFSVLLSFQVIACKEL